MHEIASKIIGTWLALTTVLPLAAQPASFGISGPAYNLVNTRTAQNQQQFYVFEDMDSGFNDIEWSEHQLCPRHDPGDGRGGYHAVEY